MQAAGIGPAATRKALTVLQGIFWCTLLIDRAQSDEGLKSTKTGRTRSVRLLAHRRSHNPRRARG
jgi:hypothetical protein